MQTFSCREFLEGKADDLWVIGNLGAHKADVESSVFQYGLYDEHDQIHVINGIFTEPGGEAMNMFNEPLNIVAELDSPQRPLLLSDTNAPFVDCAPDPRWVLTDFPYTECGPDFIASLPKKRRDNFKAAIKHETDVYLEPSSLIDDDWNAITSERYLAHNPEYDPGWYRMALSKLDQPALVFVARRAKDHYPIASIALVQSRLNPKAYLCYVFFSIEPCIRKVHLTLVETVLPAGSLLHYGASFSFDEERRKVFTYKNTIANRTAQSPSVAIIQPEMTKPYYDLNARMWIR